MKGQAGNDIAAQVTKPDVMDPATLDGSASDQRLGECVRPLRQNMGLSLQELARRAGLSIGMISQMERGLATPPLRTLRLLSLVLQVPISYFFEFLQGAKAGTLDPTHRPESSAPLSSADVQRGPEGVSVVRCSGEDRDLRAAPQSGWLVRRGTGGCWADPAGRPGRSSRWPSDAEWRSTERTRRRGGRRRTDKPGPRPRMRPYASSAAGSKTPEGGLVGPIRGVPFLVCQSAPMPSRFGFAPSHARNCQVLSDGPVRRRADRARCAFPCERRCRCPLLSPFAPCARRRAHECAPGRLDRRHRRS